MSLDLNFVAPSSDPLAIMRRAKMGGSPQDGQQNLNQENAAFDALICEMSADPPHPTDALCASKQDFSAPSRDVRKLDTSNRVDPTSAEQASAQNATFAPADYALLASVANPARRDVSLSSPQPESDLSNVRASVTSQKSEKDDISDRGVQIRSGSSSGLTQPSLEVVLAAVSAPNSSPMTDNKAAGLAEKGEADPLSPPPAVTIRQATSLALPSNSPPKNVAPYIATAEVKKEAPRRDSPHSEPSRSIPKASAAVDQPFVTIGQQQDAAGPPQVEGAVESAAPQQKSSTRDIAAIRSPNPPELLKQVTIQSLETHFPAVLSNMVSAGLMSRTELSAASEEQPAASIHIAPASGGAAPAHSQSSGPMKVLTIELEPAALGSVVVKMKMSRTSVDVQISVDSQQALQTLGSSRDKLIEAMQSAGCSVNSYTIQTDPSSTSANASQSSPMFGSANTPNGSDTLSSQGGSSGEWAGQGNRGDGQQGRANSPEDGQPKATPSRDPHQRSGLYL